MSQIIIQLSGGLVADVFIKGTGTPTKAIVVDEDIEGTDDYISVEIKCKNSNDFTYEACIHTRAIKPLPKGSDVDLIIKKYSKK